MIQDAQDELIFVNFAMNFGSPHRYNPKVAEDYAEHNYGADFATDVNRFFFALKAKIVSVPRVAILTVSDHGARENFLEPLSVREGYHGLRDALDEELYATIHTKRDIAFRLGHEAHYTGDTKGRKRLLEVDSLPIQLLIAGLPEYKSSSRQGCLVFMVGTEMLQSSFESGDAPAFYTELDSMVGMFRNLARNLMSTAQRKPD